MVNLIYDYTEVDCRNKKKKGYEKVFVVVMLW